MRNFILIITFFSLLSCKNETDKIVEKTVPKKLSDKEQINLFKDTIPKNTILSNDIEFINDSILKGKFKLDISKYNLKECGPTIKEKKKIYESYVDFGFKNLGDLNGDGKKDSVFILQPLNWCEENHGQSYYFTDNRIPRIESDSFCCHLESVFSIGDIDEDGGNEIAEYNSSCVSNFKAFRIWTLKEGKWKLVDNFTYYYNNGKYEVFKDFHKLYKKISKNKFKFLEISDMLASGEVVMEWKTVTMK